MKICFLVIGKTDQKYLQTGIDEYAKRLKHYTNFELKIIPDIKKGKKLSEEEQKKQEGDKILANISDSDQVILLDENGKQYTSNDFSKYIEKLSLSGKKRIVFVVGGPYGFSNAVYERANSKMALSLMTFSHQMVRLIFTEQLYRAYSILNNEPYHHN